MTNGNGNVEYRAADPVSGLVQPVVSIILPCYNKRAYVAAAIESALAQTTPCEVIVIDDGSTDGSLDEVKRFDGRVVWETGPNRGGSAARNRGLELAQGTWIQFLDADDLLPPEKIAVQIAALENTSSQSIAFCPWSRFHDNGLVEAPDTRRYWQSYPDGLSLLIDMWYRGGFFPPHAWLVSRRLIETVGPWNEKLSGDDDGEFFGRLLIQADELYFSEDTCVLYRDPPEGSVSRNICAESARSFWMAFEQVASAILAQRSDRSAKRACLSRVRKTAYSWCEVEEIVASASCWEQRLSLIDLSPSLPLKTRWLIGLLGIRRGLQMRSSLRT